MRTLNNLKNRKITKYDYAYVDMVTQDTEQDKQEFVSEVRQTFFKFLRPFLCEVPDYIDCMKGANDSEKVFAKYFDSKSYLQQWQGKECTNQLKFATKLLTSSQFQHFCDDVFEMDELNNY